MHRKISRQENITFAPPPPPPRQKRGEGGSWGQLPEPEMRIERL